MCTRNNDQIEAIKAAYEAEFERNLEEDLMGETSGYFRRLLVSQCNGGRDEEGDVDFDLAMEDAQKIYDVSRFEKVREKMITLKKSREFCVSLKSLDVWIWDRKL